MVEGWPPLERAELGGWLLRAAAGFTGRANSVLPLGDPGMPLSEAVDHCESWYDERGLRRLFCLFGPEGFAVDDDPLGRHLLGRDYEPFNRTAVLTAATRALPPESPLRLGSAGTARVRAFAAVVGRLCTARLARPPHRHTGCGPGRAERLTGPAVRLAGDGRRCHRRRPGRLRAYCGLGCPPFTWRRIIGAPVPPCSSWAHLRTRHAHAAYGPCICRWPHANSPARSLYDQLGFSTHHEYCYLGA